MSDRSKKISELTTTNSLSGNDLFIVVQNVAGTLSTRSVTGNTFRTFVANVVPVANSSVSGTVKVGNNLTINSSGFLSTTDTAYNLAVEANSRAFSAQTAATNANNRAFSAQTAAQQAYANAVAQISNASALTSGTLSNERFANIVQINVSVEVGQNVSLTRSTLTIGNSSVNTVINSSSINTTEIVAATISGNGSLLTSIDSSTVGGNTAAQLRNFSNSVADAAFINATAFASNATNITSGTLNTARLPSTVSLSTALNVGSSTALTGNNITTGNVVATNLSGNGASVTSVNAATVGGNTAAQLRSFSNSTAATAYANAVTYTETYASNATNITSGTLNTERLPSTVNVATRINVGSDTSVQSGLITLTGNVVATRFVGSGASLTGVNATTVGGNSASDLRTYSDTRAAAAFSNAIARSENASNITTGTLASERLPATVNVSSEIYVGSNVSLNTSALFIDNGPSGTVVNGTVVYTTNFEGNGALVTSVDSITVGGNSASQLRTYSETKASEAYSNAVSFVGNATNITTGTLSTERLPSTINVSGLITVSGNASLNSTSLFVGNSSVNTVIQTAGITFSGNITPSTNNSQIIGTPQRVVRTIYLGSNALFMNAVPISINSNNKIVVGTANLATESFVTETITEIDLNSLYPQRPVPETLGGQEGDRPGFYAISNNYFYFCTDNWLGPYEYTQHLDTANSTSLFLVPGANTRPEAGWVLTDTSSTYTVVSVNDYTEGENTYWFIELSSNATTANGSTWEVISPFTLPEIWKTLSLDLDTDVITSNSLVIGATFLANATSILIGNTNLHPSVDSTIVNLYNQNSNSALTSGSLVISEETSSFLANTTAISIGNSTVNTLLTANSLVVGGDILPISNSTQNLGSAERQWASLYVSNSTIYINNIPLTVDDGGSLIINDTPVIGNITFNDNTLIGTGDYSGINFASGNGSFTAGQYLRMRGGDDPDHIHVDTSNSEAYDQYWGDDSKYLKLERGINGNVVIGTNSKTWTFDENGNLTFPANGDIKDSEGNSLYVTNTNFTGNLALYVTNTDFTGNIALYVTNTDFTGNLALYVTNTDFTGNLALYVTNTDFTGNLENYVTNTDFIGNLALYVSNTDFTGNLALYVSNSDFVGNLENYVTNTDFVGNLALYVANTDFVGNLENYVTNTDFTGNLALYVSNSDFVGNLALYVSNSDFVGNLALYVSNSDFVGNLENYVTNTDFTGNLALYVANTDFVGNLENYVTNTDFVGNLALYVSNSDFVGNLENYVTNTDFTGNLALYVSNTDFTGNLANYAELSGATFTGNVAIGDDLIANTTTIFIGNSSVNTTITSNSMIVGGHIIPLIADSQDLGTSENPWRSLYVGTSTIYIANVPLSLIGGNTLAIGPEGNQYSIASESYVLSVTSNLTSEQILVGNSISNVLLTSNGFSVGNLVVANSTSLAIGNTVSNIVLTVDGFTISNNITANTQAIVVGNTTSNLILTSDSLNIGNTIVVNTETIIIANLTSNITLTSDSLNIGNTTIANASTISIGNNSSNIVLTYDGFTIGNTIVANTTTISIGNTLSNVVLSSNSLNIGNTVIANTSSLVLGNASSNVTITTNTLSISNSVIANTTALKIGNTTASLLVDKNKIYIVDSDQGQFLNVNTSALYVSGGTGNLYLSYSYLSLYSDTGGNFFTNGEIYVLRNYADSSNITANSTHLQIKTGDSNSSVNSSSIILGNSQTNALFSSNSINISTGISILKANSVSVSIGNASINSTINSTSIVLNGIQIVTETISITGGDATSYALGTVVVTTNATGIGNMFISNGTHLRQLAFTP